MRTMLHTFPESLAYDQKLQEHGPSASVLVGEGAEDVVGELCGIAFLSVSVVAWGGERHGGRGSDQ